MNVITESMRYFDVARQNIQHSPIQDDFAAIREVMAEHEAKRLKRYAVCFEYEDGGRMFHARVVLFGKPNSKGCTGNIRMKALNELVEEVPAAIESRIGKPVLADSAEPLGIHVALEAER